MARGREQQVSVDGHRLTLTNLDKVLYPVTGTTKAEVLDYCARAAPHLVRHAAGRPATRKRWPDGVGTAEEPGESFFEKNLPRHAPSWIRTGTIEHSERTASYPLVDDRATLAWCAQMAALELHVPQWRFHRGRPQNPDRLVFDLDPGPGRELADCAELAVAVRELLTGMGLAAFPLTSGSKGIHLYAPLDGSAASDRINEVAKALAEALQADLPDLVVATMKKTLREGKILLDWSQNNGSKTTVAPYSLRGRAEPTVAAPRTWDEIEDAASLRHLRFEEVLDRLDDDGDLLEPLGRSSGDEGDPGSPEDVPAPDQRDRLATYRSKRGADRTPEPVPDPVRDPAPGSGPRTEGERPSDLPSAPMFVVQEHHARSRHYDVRLEHDGVLVSWAVPKGVPESARENRLAVPTEDHPLAYGSFAGTIPKGEYGAGTVSIWDTGTCEIETWRDGREAKAVLHGRPDGGLGGVPVRVALVRTGTGDDSRDRWLMKRTKDQPEPDADEPRAAEDAGAGGCGPSGPGSEPDGEPAARLDPADLDLPLPMLATPGTERPLRARQDEWAFEMKWDGVRVVAGIAGGQAALRSRSGRDMTGTYPELQELVESLGGGDDTVVDGEIVALGRRGVPDFSRLQERMGLTDPGEVQATREHTEVHVMLFDLLRVRGESLLRTPYRERRERLRALAHETEHVHVPAVVEQDLDGALEISRSLRLEGVVAKTRDGIYRPGKRAKTWIKLKDAAMQSVVLIGWRRGTGERETTFASLLLAVPDADGALEYVGRVGTGFDDRELRSIAEKLDELRTDEPAAEVPSADARDARWVQPDLVGEVTYQDTTSGGRLRHPVWRGLRPDVGPGEVRDESGDQRAGTGD